MQSSSPTVSAKHPRLAALYFPCPAVSSSAYPKRQLFNTLSCRSQLALPSNIALLRSIAYSHQPTIEDISSVHPNHTYLKVTAPCIHHSKYRLRLAPTTLVATTLFRSFPSHTLTRVQPSLNAHLSSMRSATNSIPQLCKALSFRRDAIQRQYSQLENSASNVSNSAQYVTMNTVSPPRPYSTVSTKPQPLRSFLEQ